MLPESVLILGVGGTSTDIAETIVLRSDCRLIGYLDDNPAYHGSFLQGYPVLGGLSCVEDYPDALLVLAVGSPRSFTCRLKIIERLRHRRFLTVVHPTAWISPTAKIGDGSVILSFVSVSSNATLVGHNVILSHCSINHDVLLGEGTVCASGVSLSGNVEVGEGCYLGVGSVFRDGITVGPGTLVGAGAVVVSDLDAAGTFVGNPSRRLR